MGSNSKNASTGSDIGAVLGGVLGTFVFPGVGTSLGAIAGSALGGGVGSEFGPQNTGVSGQSLGTSGMGFSTAPPLTSTGGSLGLGSVNPNDMTSWNQFAGQSGLQAEHLGQSLFQPPINYSSPYGSALGNTGLSTLGLGQLGGAIGRGLGGTGGSKPSKGASSAGGAASAAGAGSAAGSAGSALGTFTDIAGNTGALIG